PLVARLAGWRPTSGRAAGSLESPAPLTAVACSAATAADLRLSSQDGLGSAPGRGGDWLRALDRLEGAQAGGDLAPDANDQAASQPVRVALPWRPAAHGCLQLCAFPAARTSRDRRPLAAVAQL